MELLVEHEIDIQKRPAALYEMSYVRTTSRSSLGRLEQVTWRVCRIQRYSGQLDGMEHRARLYPGTRRDSTDRGRRGGSLCPLGYDWVAPGHDCWVWRSRASDQQKQEGWEMWVRMEKIICLVLDEARERQLEETLEEGPNRFYMVGE